MKFSQISFPTLLLLLLLLPALECHARGGGHGGGGHGGGHGHGGHRTYYYFTQTGVGASDGYSDNCVRNTAVVGDTVQLPDGSLKAVSVLKGSSWSCANPEYPVRAQLQPVAEFSCQAQLPFNADAGIELVDGWIPVKQECKLTKKNYFFLARNQALHASLFIGSYDKQAHPDVAAYAESRRLNQIGHLIKVTASELRATDIYGLPAWQAEVRGIEPISKTEAVYMLTIIDNGNDVLFLNALIDADMYAKHKEEMEDLPFGIDGLSFPADASATLVPETAGGKAPSQP